MPWKILLVCLKLELMCCSVEYKVCIRYSCSCVYLSLFVADNNVSRREGVRKKIVEYLQYAEILQRKIVKQHQKLDVSSYIVNAQFLSHYYLILL